MPMNPGLLHTKLNTFVAGRRIGLIWRWFALLRLALLARPATSGRPFVRTDRVGQKNQLSPQGPLRWSSKVLIFFTAARFGRTFLD